MPEDKGGKSSPHNGHKQKNHFWLNGLVWDEKGKGDATGHRMVNQTDSALWRWFWGRSGTQAEKVGIHTCGEMDLQG